MIILTKRQRKILIILLDLEEYITSNDIANIIGYSVRSVRSDMEIIEDFLKEFNCSVIKKPGIGTKLNASYELRQNIKNKLNDNSLINYSSEDRLEIIILILLLKNHTTFQYIADVLKVSKPTIINQFDNVIEKLKQDNLSVKKTSGHGLLLVGEESDIRKRFIKSLAEEDLPLEIIINEIGSLKDYIDTALNIIDKICKVANISFIHTDRIKLILAYLLYRINNDQLLTHQILETNINVDDAKNVLNILEEFFPCFEEQLYAASILLSERIEYDSEITKIQVSEDEDAFKIAMYLIDSLKQIGKADFKEYEMIDGLTKHLKSAIYRYRNNIHIKNDLLEQIKLSYSLMFEFTRGKLKTIEKDYDLFFDENEIAFITMYIASIYESGVKDEITLKVLVVCSFGLATSSILKNRINSIIPDGQIIGPLSLKDAKEYLNDHEVDAIISTNEADFGDIPCVCVNPLLNKRDIDRIKNHLHQYSYAKMCLNFFKGYGQDKNDSRIDYIKDYVKAENIQIIDHIDSWKEAIELAAKPLLKEGLLEESYVSVMINAVKEYGTYMVLTPQTAYVHAGVEDGIKENCSAILIIKDPLEFGDINMKTVRCIVVLGIKDTSENNLLNIAYILEKPKNIALFKKDNIDIKQILNMNTKED